MSTHAADAEQRIAEIAHDLWRDRLEQEGWSRGSSYDAMARSHDALVPFGELGDADRREALLGVRALGIVESLADAIQYDRGPARLFTLADMASGLLVGWNTEHAPRTKDAPREPGLVLGWTADHSGELEAIEVRWADGSHSVHHPANRELTRWAGDSSSRAGRA